MGGTRSLMECLSVIPDPRVERAKRHKLIDLLVILVCATLGGADDCRSIELFARTREEWFRERLELPGGIPSHDTFRRLLARIDPEVLQSCLREWLEEVRQALGIVAASQAASSMPDGPLVNSSPANSSPANSSPVNSSPVNSSPVNPSADGTADQQPHRPRRRVVAVDGKSLRRSVDRSGPEGADRALHLVSAWATETGMSLATVRVDSKSNEIKALPAVLEMLDLKGCIVTIDAMGCQKEIARQIVEQGGDYILALKGNQEGLHERVQWFLEDALRTRKWKQSGRSYRTVEKDHGRIEKRWYYLVDQKTLGEDFSWLDPKGQWEGLGSVGIAECERVVGDQVSRERRYYISSLDQGVVEFARAIRDHWKIENSLHWVLDIAFREDECRLRKDHSAENLALLRRFAVSLFKQDKTKKVGVKNRRLCCGWDLDYLAHILSLDPPIPPAT